MPDPTTSITPLPSFVRVLFLTTDIREVLAAPYKSPHVVAVHTPYTQISRLTTKTLRASTIPRIQGWGDQSRACFKNLVVEFNHHFIVLSHPSLDQAIKWAVHKVYLPTHAFYFYACYPALIYEPEFGSALNSLGNALPLNYT